ncbi:ATP-binding protein [Pseudomonas sp.]|uniref:ATP-binding protein n=1 Tax=Pseudomonas sp. TaxID=306 RepID=UPI0028AE10B4|nr:ATP-binding protein [Pseudomonas sp.]
MDCDDQRPTDNATTCSSTASAQPLASTEWTRTPLGDRALWPEALAQAYAFLLSSDLPSAIIWGAQRRVLYNDAWIPAMGHRHPQALGHPAHDVWTSVWARVALQLDVVLEKGALLLLSDSEFPVRLDREKPWAFSLSPLRGPDGEVAGILVQGQEVHLSAMEPVPSHITLGRDRRMFDQAPGFITILRGPEHIFEFVNEAFRRSFGDRGYLGRSVREVFPDLDGQGYFAWLDNVYASGERFVATGTAISLYWGSEGKATRYLDFVYEPVFDDSGVVTGIFCEGFDVTNRVEVEQALREESRTLGILRDINAAFASDLNLERIVQNLTDAGMALTGAAYGAYFANEVDAAGAHLKLYTLSGADRSAFEKLGHPRATPMFAPTFRNEGVVRSQDILSDPRYGQFAPHHGMPEGHLPVRSYLAISVVSRTGDVLGGLFFGHSEPGRFTERHEHLMVSLAAQAAVAIDNAQLYREVQVAKATLEDRVAQRTEELSQANEALRQSQKMEALGQLTGGIAHDFNNILAAILGSADLLARRLGQGRTDNSERLLNGIQVSAKRAASLTQRLLAFSRRQTLDPRPTDINALVEDLVDLINRSVGPAISVITHLAPDTGLARIDPVQLESSLLNLAINSRDAMPGGNGAISITTQVVELAGAAALQADLPAGDYILISVADTGAGISAQDIKRIFDPFFTTKPLGQGTGLGLSMVHGFVRQSGGQIDVHSREGVGTTMRLFLPRHEGEQPAQTDSQLPTHRAPVAHSSRILVVDDEPIVRMTMVETLREAGYEVEQAEEGAGALQLLRSSAAFDLLLTDVGLPGALNGRQMADAARAQWPDLRVLFVTGFAEASVLKGGFLTPSTAVMTKPFDTQLLLEKVAKMLQLA